MLRALEAFHKKGYLHRDVKPENFRVHDHHVFLIDFGMQREYMTKEGKHIPYAAGKAFRGTPMTTSIFAHQTIEQSRRDDLISMVYSAIYINENGTLPWLKDCDEFNANGNGNIQRIIDRIYECKRTLNRSIFSSPISKNLVDLSKKLELLNFDEEPNYDDIANDITNISLDKDSVQRERDSVELRKREDDKQREIDRAVNTALAKLKEDNTK